MFALGHKPTSALHKVVSALPQKQTFAVQIGMSASFARWICIMATFTASAGALRAFPNIVVVCGVADCSSLASRNRRR